MPFTAARTKTAEVVKAIGKMFHCAMKIVTASVEETLPSYTTTPAVLGPHLDELRYRAFAPGSPVQKRGTRGEGAFPDGKCAPVLATARVRLVNERKWSDRRYLDMNLIYNEAKAVTA